MTDERIIELYQYGYSINYIVDRYWKFINNKQKPVKLNGILLFPAKLYTKAEANLYVNKLIYSYIINKGKVVSE